MSEVMEYAARLSDVIGARPGGTEEEQQASFFIEEVMANKASLETSVEEFNCNPNYELPRIICCIVSIVLTLLAIILDLMVIPAFIVTLIMAVLYVLEITGFSPLNKVSKRGISQNVVGKYIPGAQQNDALLTGSSDYESDRPRRTNVRKRKIILIARYDSGKVSRELQKPIFGMLDIIKWAEIAAIALIPIILLIRMISSAEGTFLIVLNVLLIIAAIIVFIPVVFYLIHQSAPYSDGANNNASGVAVMLEVAKRISEGFDATLVSETLRASSTEGEDSDSDGSLAAEITMHGKDELLASGMLPDGAELVYGEGEAKTVGLPQEGLPAEGLLATAEGASAAEDVRTGADADVQASYAYASQAGMPAASAVNAANTIQPVGSVVVGGANASQSGSTIATAFASSQNAMAAGQASSNPRSNIQQQDNVPDWFKKGIEAANAKKEAQYQNVDTSHQRSKYADVDSAAAQMDMQQNVSSVVVDNNANAASSTRMSQASIEAAAGEMLLDGSIQTVERASVSSSAPLNYGEQTTIEDAIRQSEASYPAERTSVTGKPVPAWPPVASDERDRTVLEAAATLEEDVAQAKERIAETEAQATAQAVENLEEQAAILDRTISYIPVAAEIPAEATAEAVSALNSSEGSIAESLAKTPGEILAEASSLAEDGEFAAAAEEEMAKEELQNRKKRSISLPSLTGAIASMSEKKQAAPLAESDVKEDGSAQSGQNQRRSRRLKAANIPSPTDAVVKSARPNATISIAEGSDSVTSIATTDAKEDAAKALSSLDVVAEEETISPQAPSVVSQENPRQARRKKRPHQTNTLPVIGAAEAKLPTVNAVGSFAVGSKTGSFEPVGEELIADMVEDDIIVQDVDDSAYQQNVTSTGAYAGPGYVNMPKSRADRIKGIFGRKKANAAVETSFAEAIGIDKDYEARKVGTARGGWESFQDESAGFNQAKSSKHSHIDQYSSNSRSLKFEEESWDDGAWAEDEWNGGAFSLNRKGSAKKSRNGGLKDVQRRKAPGSMLSELAAEAADEVNASESAYVATSGSIKHVRASDMPRDLAANNGAVDPAMDDFINEREQIRSFRTSSAPLTSFSDVAAFASSLSAYNGEQFEEEAQEEEAPQGLQTEVWFVALGAELSDNAGIKAFLADHADEMRGSIIIELDALGAGELSLIETEGMIKHTKITSRMKRYATKAASALGIKLNSAKMEWRDSASYFAATKGFQTIHVAGLTDGKPTYMGEADDTYENLSEDSLMEGVAFTLELIHSI